jgi:hypothetical protein
MTATAYDSRRQAIWNVKNNVGADVFRIERDGTVYCKQVLFADGTSVNSAGGISPTPAEVDGGSF